MPGVRRFWILGAVVVLVGCGDSGQGVVRGEEAQKSPSSPPAAEPAPAEVPKSFEPSEPARKAIDSRLAISPPGSKGWKPEPNQMVSEAEKMDRALLDLRESLASTQLIAKYKDGTFDVKSDWKIRDDRTFSIQYFSPDSGPQQNLLRGDGKRRVELAFGEWKNLPPYGEKPKSGDVSLEKLPLTIVRSMASPFRTGEPVWGPLIGALARGEGGYTLKSESQVVQVHGKERKILRYIAERSKPTKATVEIVVDAQRSVPLTVRASEERPDGGEDRVMWTAKWSFQGGKHQDSDFVVPTKP
jgi:hypothetical protein